MRVLPGFVLFAGCAVATSSVAACGGGGAGPDGRDDGGPSADGGANPDARRDGGGPGGPDAAGGRSTVDRPDDSPLPQVQAVYALASDGADRQFDVAGNIARSVDLWNDWLAAETGGIRLRLDTYQGELDVLFVRLDRTEAELAASGIYLRNELEASMNRLGLLENNKMYAMYYDGPSDAACGGGAFPPSLVGQVGALYLGAELAGYPPCDDLGLGAQAFPQYLEFAMIHELFHTLGIVAACAPHNTLTAHVSDGANDLMYSGNQPWQPNTLDNNQDDYYNTGSSSCLRLDNSAFLDPQPANPVMPPGWGNRAPAPTEPGMAGCLLPPAR